MSETLRYAFWHGCVARGACPELYDSTVAVAEKLGIELVDLHNGNCTGAGVLSERNPLLADTLNARTFAMAEALKLPIINHCSTCQGAWAESAHRLNGDEARLAEVNSFLAPEKLHYSGNTEPRHLLWILLEDYGLERLRGMVVNPLRGLRIAPFYGCYILRPSNRLGMKDHPDRQRALELLVEAIGGEVVHYSGANKCCGFPLLTLNRKNSLSMASSHLIEAKVKGSDVMVTPCPLCHLNLDAQQPDAMKVAGSHESLPVVHMTQLIGLALGIDPRVMRLDRHVVSTAPVVAKVEALTA
ncbi:MAG: CoB--CoM heterodisulfide reductase iron-sulfur subunit B family protein [Candidatus Dormibacteria bacterium]